MLQELTKPSNCAHGAFFVEVLCWPVEYYPVLARSFSAQSIDKQDGPFEFVTTNFLNRHEEENIDMASFNDTFHALDFSFLVS